MTELKTVKRSRTMVWSMVVLVAAATGYGLWFFLSGPNISKYAPIITELADGKLNGDDRGRIDLSRSSPGLTPHDEIFITRRADGSFVTLFPTYYAKGPMIAGLMYTSRPLTEQDLFLRHMAVGFNDQIISIGGWRKLAINQKIDEHWYKVSYGM
jgi:hypothetical protein